MTKINHIIQDIIPPYSPGAVYHELNLLEKDKMITINHNGLITITPQGLDFLHCDLLERPLPKPLLSRLVKILALLSLADPTKRATGVHKIQIEMIKNNHLSPQNEHLTVGENIAPINKLSFMSQELNKAILSFIAKL